MVYFKAAKTAAFYKSTSPVIRSLSGDGELLSLTRIPSATPSDGNDYKAFLALYQTDRAHCLEHPEYTEKVRSSSELWDKASSCHDVGSFAPVDLELMEPHGRDSDGMLIVLPTSSPTDLAQR